MDAAATPEPTLPSVFEFLDYRAYLREWFAVKQQLNPRYSHRLFASKAGFSSPSLLHLVIKGQRNITAGSLPRFAKGLGLVAEERSFLELLVALDRATRLDERNAVYEQIRSRKHFRAASDIEKAGFEYLSDWVVPATRELAGCPGFRMEARWVANHLRPRVSPQRAQRALDLLLTLGMLEATEEGGATQTEASVVTAHEVAGLAVFRYHSSMGALAAKALETYPAPERHFGAVTVRVSEERLAKLKVAVGEFQEHVLALCDEVDDGDRVMQLNLQLFPLSKVIS